MDEDGSRLLFDAAFWMKLLVIDLTLLVGAALAGGALDEYWKRRGEIPSPAVGYLCAGVMGLGIIGAMVFAPPAVINTVIQFQIARGNAAHPFVAVAVEYRALFIYAAWAVSGLGTLIALPVAISHWSE